MNVNRKTSFQILLDEWRLLNFYGRFEARVSRRICEKELS
jgi:hypothetical protein